MGLNISPVVTAADLLDQPCKSALEAAFEIRGVDLTCIMMGFFRGPTETVLSAPVNIIIRHKGQHEMMNWREVANLLSPEERLVLASAVLNLQQMWDIPDVLTRIGVHTASTEHPFQNLSVFRSAIIASQDGFDDWAWDRRAKITADPDAIKNRAGICTIIGPLARSRHEAMSLIVDLQRDFRTWVEVQHNSLAVLRDIMKLELMDPKEDDLLAVYCAEDPV
jgi:hypothetical protein